MGEGKKMTVSVLVFFLQLSNVVSYTFPFCLNFVCAVDVIGKSNITYNSPSLLSYDISIL